MPGQVEQLSPQPSIISETFAGYQHFTDPTKLPFNVLTYPSVNCFMPSRDKIVPRLGKTRLGVSLPRSSNVIAFDNAASDFISSNNALSYFHDVSGDLRILFVSISIVNSGDGDQVGSVEYNGVSMTQLTKLVHDADRCEYLYYLVNPTAGHHIVHITTAALLVVDSIAGASTSYTGADQDYVPLFNTAGPTGSLSALTLSVTTDRDDSWLVGFFQGSTGLVTAGASTTSRIVNGSDHNTMVDSGGSLSIGSNSLHANYTAPTTASGIIAAFAPFTLPDPTDELWPIIGHKERYTNDGGYDLEVRVVQTDQDTFKDQIEVLFPNPGTGELTWYPITETINPLPRLVGDRYYFDVFLDTNLNPARSRRNSRLIWVNGNRSSFSWSGGIAPITAVVANTSITTDAGTSWRALGFIPLSEGGSDSILINGNVYEITSGWNTQTLLLSNTNGISVDDVAFAYINPDDTTGLDVINIPDTMPALNFCKQYNNYMFYGSFNSRSLFQSNAFGKDGSAEITNSFVTGLDTLTIPVNATAYGAYIGLGTHVYRITIDATDSFAWQKDGGDPTSGVTIDGTVQTIDDVLDIRFVVATTGYTVGDYWDISVVEPIEFSDTSVNPPSWANFYYTLPVRVPGEGYIYTLPANFWTMEVQEGDLYVNDRFGQWGFVNTQLGADLQTETVSFTPLKQNSSSKVIYPYMVSHLDNYLIYVTENKKVDLIGRQQFLELPQIGYLSQPVELDFQNLSFTQGSMEYLDKLLYITSPLDNTMMVYDNRAENKYWQPPQIITENGILSIIGDTLISHSNLRNISFNLFTGTSGDDGAEYTVRARTALTAYFRMVNRHKVEARWDSKWSSNSFIEGYIIGNPQLIFTAFTGVNDTQGYSHIVIPVKENNDSSRASFGQGTLGSHPLGSDASNPGQYFNEIYRKFSPILSYYFIALQIACTAKTHSYSILSLGVNMSFSPTGNNSLIGDREIL